MAHLVLLLRIIKSSILEATFKGQNHINKHYDDHVLKPDEEFTPSNPKFPYMEKEEYLKALQYQQKLINIMIMFIDSKLNE